jgi:hypothetical protein
MSAKDAVIGTTKRFVAEIVGDGALAEEGSRQANGNAPFPVPENGTAGDLPSTQSDALERTVPHT